MRFVLFANGIMEETAYIPGELRPGDKILCLDGGLLYAHDLGIAPDYILGDFDSVDRGLLEQYRAQGVHIEAHPARKDFTDMELGLDFAVGHGADQIIIFGGLGGRTDHWLANIFVLMQAVEKGIYPVLYGVNESERVYISDKSIKIAAPVKSTLSIIPLTPVVEGVTTKGLDYPLRDENLYFQYARGVSNILKAEEATIEIRTGTMLVVVNKGVS